jgi:hypothetical protein
MNRVGMGLKIALVPYILLWRLGDSRNLRALYRDASPRSPLYGIYDVDTFVRNERVVPPLATDGTRWRRMIFDGPAWVSIRLMDDSTVRYRVAIDTAQTSLRLVSAPDGAAMALRYARPYKDRLVLEGLNGNDSIRVTLRRLDESQLLLLRQGFHWVQDFPVNR